MTASAIERPGSTDASASTVITLADYQQAVEKKAPPRKVPATSERAIRHARKLLAKRKGPLPRDNWAAIRVLEHLRKVGIAPPAQGGYIHRPIDTGGGD